MGSTVVGPILDSQIYIPESIEIALQEFPEGNGTLTLQTTPGGRRIVSFAEAHEIAEATLRNALNAILERAMEQHLEQE
jgi:hypothetical protein